MQVPLEITFRDVPKTERLKEIIERLAAKLEEKFDQLDSCRVAVEQPSSHGQTFRELRVRIDMTAAPGHELVVTRSSAGGSTHDNPEGLVRAAFQIAARRLGRLKDLQLNRAATRSRRRLKQHLAPLPRRGTKTRYNTQSIAR